MSLLSPWLLAGFAALVPLLALHLRRRRRRREVASLRLWRELPAAAPTRRRAAIVPSLPLLLQALVIVLLVLALARPEGDGGTPSAGAPPRVVVVDPALTSAGRLPAARAALAASLATASPHTPVTVVLATGRPRLLSAERSPAEAVAALEDLADETRLGSDPRLGLALAAGQLHRDGGQIVLLHAPETALPRVATEGVAFAAEQVGDGGGPRLTPPVARCLPPSTAEVPPSCTVLAAVVNRAPQTREVRLTVTGAGDEPLTRTLSLSPGERSEVTFPAVAGSDVTVTVSSEGTAAAQAVVTVPDPTGRFAVTLVSDRAATAPLPQALAAVPGVRLERVAPGAYDAEEAGASDLLVLDRWLPDGGLPAAQALLLVAPPRLPGGEIGAALADAQLSGRADDALLAGIDLDALVISSGAARATELPDALRALAWSPEGPLFAAGSSPGPTALLTFDPQRSTLPQLPAFPALLSNIVTWARTAERERQSSAAGSGPGGASAQPRAAGSAQTAAGDADLAQSTAVAPITLRASDGGGPLPGPPREWWPWLAAAALVLLLVEWTHPRWRRRGAAR